MTAILFFHPDFRQVYATVLEKWLGGDSGKEGYAIVPRWMKQIVRNDAALLFFAIWTGGFLRRLKKHGLFSVLSLFAQLLHV